ncbi:MAG: hypothetical protein V3T83_19815, partial [Acidobacteriota bacterium]
MHLDVAPGQRFQLLLGLNQADSFLKAPDHEPVVGRAVGIAGEDLTRDPDFGLAGELKPGRHDAHNVV